ncbi:MAG: hypothetical protein ABSF90_10850 [Syntrophobacteraceae bacterium]|jgi:hypothetical protein
MAKKKINDDTLLQLIRDGNSPAEAARFFVGGKLRKCSAREDKTRHQLQPPCQKVEFNRRGLSHPDNEFSGVVM